MVVLSIKQQDGECFLFETTTNSLNENLIQSLVEVYNARLRARFIVQSIRNKYLNQQVNEMVKDEATENVADINIQDGQGTDLDSIPAKSSNDGYKVNVKQVGLLRKSINELDEYLNSTSNETRVATRFEIIEDKIDNVRGAVLMTYPEGLPKSETLIALNWNQEEQKDYQMHHGNFALASKMLVATDTKLWCAGKEMMRGQMVSNLLGTNEKTKVICKLVKSSDGPPMREPIVNDKEREAMVHYYMKRQEELKRLADSEGIDDDYLNSEWADTKQMKKSLQGIDYIKMPGMHFM